MVPVGPCIWLIWPRLCACNSGQVSKLTLCMQKHYRGRGQRCSVAGTGHGQAQLRLQVFSKCIGTVSTSIRACFAPLVTNSVTCSISRLEQVAAGGCDYSRRNNSSFALQHHKRSRWRSVCVSGVQSMGYGDLAPGSAGSERCWRRALLRGAPEVRLLRCMQWRVHHMTGAALVTGTSMQNCVMFMYCHP